MHEGEPESDPKDPSEILDEWLRRREGEAAPAPRPQPQPTEEWLAQHPEHGSTLRASLEVIGDLDRAMAGGAPVPVPESALSRLDPAMRPASRPVLLREESEAGPPLLSSRSAVEGRYQIAGEIARGGMGVVLKGYDVDLAREVAVKVLREDHADRPDLVRRFVEEAQIGGQLQHPGIAPIYEIGVDGTRRPYFSMKLVRGRTLAALLEERGGGAKDPTPFLTTFSSVCQTVAYAHSRGVIHRDLKPSNVMVGSFGEVLVMDWGMSKVLARGGVEDERRSQAQSAIRPVTTVRSRPGSGSDSLVGSVMGTGPYMSPEQARGEVDSLDERTDVFGLGAILCEILTGKPPYAGTPEDVLLKAFHGDLADAHARLAACGADPALVGLAWRCLAPARDERPRDGAAVAREVTAHLASVEERRRAAETDLARAEVRVAEERKRRRLSLALSAAVLGLVALGGGGWIWSDAQRRDREAATDRLVSEAIEEATRLRAGAGDAEAWTTALAAARRAQSISKDQDASAATRDRAIRTLAEVESAAEAAERLRRQTEGDMRLIARLDEIRLTLADHFQAGATRREYREALAAHGLDPLTADPRTYASKLRDSIRLPVILALGNWREKLRLFGHPTAALDAVLEACDPDPWRARLRAARTTEDLRRLAADAESEHQDVESLLALGERLGGSDSGRLDFARRAWARRPDDFWVNYFAGSWARVCSPPRLDEALRFASAAVALRPGSAAARYLLGSALLDRGDLDGAEAALREALRGRYVAELAHVALGRVHRRRGNEGAAEAELRRALELQPAHADALLELGDILGRRGDAAGEEKAYRDAVGVAPESASAHDSLGTVLFKRRSMAEAEAEHREAIRLDPTLANAYSNLGNVLDAKGEVDAAISAYGEAIRLGPSHTGPRFNLGILLWNQGDLAGAERVLRDSARFGMAYARAALGNVLLLRGDLPAAETELREFLRAHPADTEGRVLLGRVLEARGEFDAAETQFRDLIRDLRGANGPTAEAPVFIPGEGNAQLSGASSEIADVYSRLAGVLLEVGNREEAEAVSREAVEARPSSPLTWHTLGTVFASAGRSSDALDALRKSRDLDPTWKDSLAERTLAMVEDVDRRVERILAGKEKPRDAGAAMTMTVSGWLKVRGHLRAAADLSEATVREAPPDEAMDLVYNAACFAALAGTDPRADAEGSEERRAAWRAAAVGWLRTRLTHLGKVPRARRWEVVRELRTWQRDPDFAGLRGSDALARLPEGERGPLQALWEEVERIAVDRAAP